MKSGDDENRAARLVQSQIDALLDRVANLRVLVVGDLMLDDYRLGEIDRVSPEAPVPIVRVRDTGVSLGGAGNVARGVRALGAACDLVGAVGADAEGDQVLALLTAAGIDPSGIVRTPERPTSHKLRILARGRQVLRVDRETCGPFSEKVENLLRKKAERIFPAVDGVILQDYGKGIFSGTFAAWLIELAKLQGTMVAADPKDSIARFRGVNLLKPNLAEALASVSVDASDPEGRRMLAEKLQRESCSAEVVVTRGGEGMTAIDADGLTQEIPALRAEVFDVQGAGDTALAALALCRAAGASLVDACIVANAAARVVVGKTGTAEVSAQEVRETMPKMLEALPEKLRETFLRCE